MPMTVFEIRHRNKDQYEHLSFIVNCDKLTDSDFKTKPYNFGYAGALFAFKHDANKNVVTVRLTVLPKNKDGAENIFVTCNETKYAKLHTKAASYKIGETRYMAGFNNELIFCINMSVCDAKDKVTVESKDTTFNFTLSASEENTVAVHKLCINRSIDKDIASQGVTLKDLEGKINKAKTKTEVKLTERGVSGKVAVLEYVGEQHSPEIAAAMSKSSAGFVAFSFKGMDVKCNKKQSIVIDKINKKSSRDLTERFVIIHQNAQSVNDKTVQLNSLNGAHKPDVLALSEVFHRKNEMERVQLTEYVLANCYCRTSVAHGGVAIYVREGLQYTQRNDLQQMAEQVHFEITAIEINCTKLVVIALYRTGNGRFSVYLEKLELLLDRLTGENKRFLIVGDHNVHEITEDNSKRRQRRKVEYVLNSYGCINTVKFMTRGDASLDCGIANHARNDLVVKLVDENISDHSAQVFKFSTEKWDREGNAFESVERRLFDDGAIHLLYQDILINGEERNRKPLDVNKEFDKLFKVMTRCVDLHFPNEKKTTVPWLDEEMKGYLEQCHGLLEVRRQYPDNVVVSDVIKDVTFEARQNLIKKRIDKCFPKTDQWDIWQTGRIFKSEIFQEDPSKYSVLNEETASNVTTDIAELELPYVTDKLLDNTLQTILDTALDIGDVTLSVIFCVWPAVTNCLAVLLNATFEKGVYPDVLKISMSAGNRSKDEESYYTPIVIQPIIIKTVESIIATHLVNHLNTNHLLVNRHYMDGVRVSATMIAQEIFDHVVTGLDDKRKMAGIFCDLSKAFNVVNHKLLLNKLFKYGVRDKALSLIQSFLEGYKNVQQNATVQGNFNYGVPQGSVLGRVLFLLYVNDLPQSIDVGRCVLAPDGSSAIIMVAGDTYGNLQGEISKVFQELSSWLLKNDLPTVNFEVMNFSCIAINKPPLENLPLCDKYEFIDFIFDANFSWKCHVDRLCDKLSSAVFALRKLKPLVSKKALKQMYYKYFHWPMSHGTLVWGNSVDAENVMAIQKRALRTLEGVAANYEDSKKLFRKKRILTHYSQYLFEVVMFARVNRIEEETHRLKFAESNPRICGPNLYTKIPVSIRNQSDEAFTSHLGKLLLDNPLYSVDEFSKLIKKVEMSPV